MEESQTMYPQEEQQRQGWPIGCNKRPQQPEPKNLVEDIVASLKNPQEDEGIY